MSRTQEEARQSQMAIGQCTVPMACVCVCMCIHVYMCVWEYVRESMGGSLCVRVYVCMYVCVSMYLCVCVHVWLCIFVCACVSMCDSIYRGVTEMCI